MYELIKELIHSFTVKINNNMIFNTSTIITHQTNFDLAYAKSPSVSWREFATHCASEINRGR